MVKLPRVRHSDVASSGYNFLMRKKNRIIRALDNLMTPEQYVRQRHDTPYLYTLGNDDDALTFVGARHTNDVSSDVAAKIVEQMDTHQPEIVFVEGVQSLGDTQYVSTFISRMTPEEAMERGGEPVFTIKQALERGIEWRCPEPTDYKLLNHLVFQFYDRQEIIAWYVLRLLSQYHGRGETMAFQAYVAPFLSSLQKQVAWPHVSYEYDVVLATASEVLGHVVNIHNTDLVSSYTDPIPWESTWEQQSRFNDISRAALRYRDRAIVRNVSDVVLNGKNTLVVYGAGHAVMQEPAYIYLLGQ